MSTEFRCPQCDQTLHVPEDSVGRTIVCKRCGKSVRVPTTDTFSASIPAPPGGSGVSRSGPAHGPSPSMTPGSEQAAGHVAILRPTWVGTGEMLGRAWGVFSGQLGTCVLFVWVAGIIIVSGSACAAAVQGGLAFFAWVVEGRAAWAFLGGRIVVQLLVFLFSTWMTLGLVGAMLKVARGQYASLDDLFEGGRFLFRVVVAEFLVGLLAAVILLGCLGLSFLVRMLSVRVAGPLPWEFVLGGAYFLAIVPILVLQLTFGFSRYLIVDYNLGILASLRLSARITSGNKRTMLFAVLVVIFLLIVPMIVGSFALVGAAVVTGGPGATIGAFGLVGLVWLTAVLFLGPYLTVLWTVFYLGMTEQTTADGIPSADR